MIDYPKISVVTITYGHENFIEQTFDGVFMQDYKGEIEFIISNDHSPDATDRVIKDYLSVKEIPINFIIKYTQHEVNKGMMTNFIWALEQASGKYIALCEGDDYWTDPLKLQKQVEFLETNQEYVLTFHPVQILNTDGVLVEDFITKVPENYEYQETLASGNNYIHTPSVLFRNIITSFPPEFMLSPIGDYFLYMILTNHGKIKIMNDTMAVYRQGVGVWSDLQLPERLLNTMFCIKLISSHFKDNKRILQLLSKQHFDLLKKLTNIEEKRTEIIDSFVIDLHQVSTRLTFGSLAKTAVIKIRRKLNKK